MCDLSLHDKAVLNCVFNPSLPLNQVYNEDLSAELQDVEDNTREVVESKKLELNAIRKAEEGQFDDALNILNTAIAVAPDRASLYNNRAQVYQFMGNLDCAFEDLSKAIDLGKDKQQRTTCQAFAQRGLLYRKVGKIELAKEDFARACKMGSTFAKNQLIELNPYAAMCNQMLKQAFESLK